MAVISAEAIDAEVELFVAEQQGPTDVLLNQVGLWLGLTLALFLLLLFLVAVLVVFLFLLARARHWWLERKRGSGELLRGEFVAKGRNLCEFINNEDALALAARGGFHDPKSSLLLEILGEHDVLAGEEESEGQKVPVLLYQSFFLLQFSFVFSYVFYEHILAAELHCFCRTCPHSRKWLHRCVGVRPSSNTSFTRSFSDHCRLQPVVSICLHLRAVRALSTQFWKEVRKVTWLLGVWGRTSG